MRLRMPLTEKGRKIKRSMKKQYGKEKGKEVFYASEKAGTITGVHNPHPPKKLVNKVQKKLNKVFKKGY